MRTRKPLRAVAAGLLLASAVPLLHEPLYAAAATPRLARALRRARKHDSLTGAWTGAYLYPYSQRQTPFNATLDETAGAFTGTIDEPNTFGWQSVERLSANVRGRRDGLQLSFIKHYDGTGGASHTVAYQGAVDAEFTRVDGTWSVREWSGPFFMERSDAAAEAAISRALGASA